MKYPNIREEELKNRVAQDYFADFDCSKIVGNIDFCVTPPRLAAAALFETESLLWAEAKKGKSDVYKSIVQLILTIGKARTFDRQLPPAFLGAFDAEQFALLPYNAIQEVFYLNDFNWNVTPSNHDTREFRLVLERVQRTIDTQALRFAWGKDDRELRAFVAANFVAGKADVAKIRIDKNNFIVIYNKWLAAVKPSIAVNWDVAKRNGIIDGDFYLADLLARDNETLKEKLYVVLKKDHYESNRKIDEMGMFNSSRTQFNDNQTAHHQFWNKYDRPPKEEYWDYLIKRRDLLVPQDVRERKGSFFTPQIWVELSQRYMAEVLGEDWQEDYFVWDCAAGTGNLLAGLTNKYNIFASTLDRQDVDVMKDRIKNGANLLENHVFQFDFLNDDFSKLPAPLLEIINDPDKRKKLVVYINPPYAESGSGVGRSFKGKVATENKTYFNYQDRLGKASNELFAQFLIRIYFEIPNCFIAEFSKLKLLSGSNSATFRNYFLAKLEKAFVTPAVTFDNVKGQFPIGFFIWNTAVKEKFEQCETDVFDADGIFKGKKSFHSFDKTKGRINDWLRKYFDKKTSAVGILHNNKNDFQHNTQVRITTDDIKDHTTPITINNLIQTCIYLAVRHCIEATWLNDRDQFLYPNEGWQTDTEFQNNCLAYALFHGQNRISASVGINHWLPFTETEVEARERFASRFMTDYMRGRLKQGERGELFEGGGGGVPSAPLAFSAAAKGVFAAGLALWRYYHQQPHDNVNASLYDIREFFQGRNAQGRMNPRSTDAHYSELIAGLREALKGLGQEIEPKIYGYGFLV